MNFGNEAEVSKASAQIWQSGAGMKSTVEWMTPARRVLPTLEAPPGTAHVRQGLQGSAFWGVGQVVARLAAVQVTSPDGPDHLTGLAPLGYPHPLGAETVGAGPLGSLRHRYLPPGAR